MMSSETARASKRRRTGEGIFGSGSADGVGQDMLFIGDGPPSSLPSAADAPLVSSIRVAVSMEGGVTDIGTFAPVAGAQIHEGMSVVGAASAMMSKGIEGELDSNICCSTDGWGSAATALTPLPSLQELLRSGDWQAAEARVRDDPSLAASESDPSPLALACRLGAPLALTSAILFACPDRLWLIIDARGGPLHEAVACDTMTPDVVALLLHADETLTKPNQLRAMLLQDVDGYTPLHLLIRKQFQTYVDDSAHLMQLLQMLVSSCPETVVVPHRGEYEEPPIVMALKANIYSPMLQSEESAIARFERNIYRIVECMLEHYPQAASCVFNGYRGHYTALHSAVFHGRCPETIELLLETERMSPSEQKAPLLANTQGELPLHFCAMRGESPRTIALLANAAPEAVLMRDASGLTPLHWLWIRFISNLLALDDGGRGSSITMTLGRNFTNEAGSDATAQRYVAFTSLRQGNFEADLQLLNRLDPPVDFFRMRHIPIECIEMESGSQWAERSADLLKQIRDRYELIQTSGDGTDGVITWTRIEAVTSLFWTKVVSLLLAASKAEHQHAVDEQNELDCNHFQERPFSLLHTAFSASCCVPPVARMAALLFPDEMNREDRFGRKPLHAVSMRPWHPWDWPREDGTSGAASNRLLCKESISLMRTALELSPPEALHHADNNQRLPIHYAVGTLVRACSLNNWACDGDLAVDMMEVLSRYSPDSFQVQDPITRLVPFQLASALAAEQLQNLASGSPVLPREELPLSFTYMLLRECPFLVQAGIP